LRLKPRHPHASPSGLPGNVIRDGQLPLRLSLCKMHRRLCFRLLSGLRDAAETSGRRTWKPLHAFVIEWETALAGDSQAELQRLRDALGEEPFRLIKWMAINDGDLAGWTRSLQAAGLTACRRKRGGQVAASAGVSGKAPAREGAGMTGRVSALQGAYDRCR
jgi:hypothetical protein